MYTLNKDWNPSPHTETKNPVYMNSILYLFVPSADNYTGVYF